MTYRSVEHLLSDARAGLDRLTPQAARSAVTEGALLVDIRPQWQRRDSGEIPGSWVIERNHLEWRLHPDSDARVSAATAGQRWIVMCAEGYSSSLAAAVLNSIGVPATDLEGGFAAWDAAGLPVVDGVITSPDQQVPTT